MATLTFVQDYGGRKRLPSGIEFETAGADTFTIAAGDPLSAVARSDRIAALSRPPGWTVRVETSSVLTADAERFLLTNALDAYEHDTRLFSRSWSREIPRDFV